jgi:23S rRNA A2030 N6-methylase RlmJ
MAHHPEGAFVDWKLTNDPENIENRNAGNGGDLVKHTLYLTTLRFLLSREPWSNGLLLRECHAGRGVYRIPDGDKRARLLSALFTKPSDGEPVLLQNAQRNILGALECWPNGKTIQWYAGSALINAYALAKRSQGSHRLEFYELDHGTRRILRAVLADAAARGLRLPASIVTEGEPHRDFDGEAYIE